MRGEIAYKILDFFENKSAEMLDLLEVFLESGYGASAGKINYKFDLKQSARHSEKIHRERKRKLQKYIYKLKKEGFISENSFKKLSLSKKGKEKFEVLKKNKAFDKNSYKKEAGKEVIIISYDIPLLFNRERNALRGILKTLGFNMVHQSVWVGKIKLPENFVSALEQAGILNYVEILKVTKSGSLKEM
jgi:DNA-binding transcriptional regulator PaaX